MPDTNIVDDLMALSVVTNPAATRRIRAAKARVRTKTGNAKILSIGDSTTAGTLIVNSYVTRLAEGLTARGLPATEQSVAGTKVLTTAAAYLAYDPRFNRGDWTYDGGRTSIGASVLRLDTATGACTFTPSKPVDSFTIRYMQNPGYGSIGVTIGGNAPVSGPATISGVNGATALVWASATVKAATPSLAPIVISKTVAGGFFLGSLYGFDSTTPSFSLINGGWAGSQSADWNISDTSFRAIPSIVAEAADLVIIGLGINDWDTGQPIANFIANMTAIVTAARTVSDVMLIVQPQTNPATNANDAAEKQKLFTDALAAIAVSTNSMLFDVRGRFGDYQNASAAGLMLDDRHPNTLGYSDWGDGIADAIARL